MCCLIGLLGSMWAKLNNTIVKHNLLLSLPLHPLSPSPSSLPFPQVDSSNDTTYVANQMEDSSLRTLISYDVGATWHRLSPPEENETECVMVILLCF